MFSDSFCQFLWQQMEVSADASHYVTNNPQFLRKKISEKDSCANTYENYIVSKDYCIAHHEDKTCFWPTCKYHIILLGEIEELLRKLDIFCFTYQHVGCLYILFEYRLSGKIIAKRGNVFENVQRAISVNLRSRGVEKMPSIVKRGSWEKKLNSIFWVLSKRTN